MGKNVPQKYKLISFNRLTFVLAKSKVNNIINRIFIANSLIAIDEVKINVPCDIIDIVHRGSNQKNRNIIICMVNRGNCPFFLDFQVIK